MVIGIHATTEGIATSEGDIIKKSANCLDILDWLIGKFGNQTLACYDLETFLASLLKLLEFSKSEAEAFYMDGRIQGMMDKYSIKCDRPRSGRPPSNAFINSHTFIYTQFDFDHFKDSCKIYNMVEYLETHYDKVSTLEDAVVKAKEAKSIAEALLDNYRTFKNMKLDHTKLRTPVSALLKKYNVNPAKWDNIPDPLKNLVADTLKGGWFEFYEFGSFEKVYDYDINGAYGASLLQIPHWDKGTWLNSVDIPDTAKFGFARVFINTEADFHPFVTKFKDDDEDGSTHYTCTGEYEIAITLHEIRLFEKYKLGTVKIIDGWWWSPNIIEGKKYPLGYYQPFQGIVNAIWRERENKTGLTKSILQKMYSGIYGRTIAKYGKDEEPDELYNPATASTVQMLTRVQVFETCMSMGIVPLAILVDGFVTDKEIPLPTGTGLGQWKLSCTGKAIIAGDGAMAIEGRGTTGELAIDYDWLSNEIKNKPNAKKYTISKYSPIKMTEAIDTDFSKLGSIHEVSRTISVGLITKRRLFSSEDYLLNITKGADLLAKKRYSTIPYLYSTAKQIVIGIPKALTNSF